MSAYGTKKPGGSRAVQLTFPKVFEEEYVEEGATPMNQPDAVGGKMSYQIGDDFQAVWHRQKMEDAHRMARAKVQSTINADTRAFTAPHNMPDQPRAILSQRKFANPSHGAQSAYWDRPVAGFSGGGAYESASDEECADGELRGGVLRTSQGQAYGKSLLQARIGQLNAINQASQMFSQGQPTPARTEAFTGERTQVGLDTNPAVELASLLQSVLDTLIGGVQDQGNATEPGKQGVDTSRLTFQDSYRAFTLIVRLASSGTSDDIDNVLEFINGSSAGDGILPALEELTITPPEFSTNAKAKMLLSLKEFWTRVKAYLEKMIKIVDRPSQERSNASSAYIQSLGFKKMMGSITRRGLPTEFLDPQSAQEARDTRSARFDAPTATTDSSSSTSYSDGPSEGGFPTRQTAVQRARSRLAGSEDSSEAREQAIAEMGSQESGHRSRRGRGFRTREDSQHGYSGEGGASFDSDERNRFAYNSGAFDTGGRNVGWAGEDDGVAYGEAPQMVAQVLGGVDEEGEAEGSQDGPEDGAPRPEFQLSSRRDAFGDWDVAPRLGISGATRLATPDSRPPASEAPSGASGAPSPATPGLASPALRAPVALPPFLTARAQLPKTIEGYRQLATRINAHYGNRLPDGRGSISVGHGTLPSVRANFVRRLGL